MSVRSCTKCGESLGHYPGPLCNVCDLISPTIGANQCEHGQLARVCEVCELKARLAECERERDKVCARLEAISRARMFSLTPEGLYEFGRALIAAGWHNNGANIADAANAWRNDRAEVARLTSQLESRDPTKSQVKRITAMAGVERLEAELAALREAVEKAPHAPDCRRCECECCDEETVPCSCWKRDALGK